MSEKRNKDLFKWNCNNIYVVFSLESIFGLEKLIFVTMLIFVLFLGWARKISIVCKLLYEERIRFAPALAYSGLRVQRKEHLSGKRAHACQL